MKTRIFIVLMIGAILAGCSSAKPVVGSDAPVYDQPVDVWIVPVRGIPDAYVVDLVDRLNRDGGLHARASVEAGVSEALFFSDKSQMVGEKALTEYAKIKPQLAHSTPRTIYIFLTPYDLNGADRRFRFLFAMNNGPDKVAIISLARLRLNMNGSDEVPSVTSSRLYKMARRQIGEMYYGYPRSSDRGSVMYSPLMGLGDVDMIGTRY